LIPPGDTLVTSWTTIASVGVDITSIGWGNAQMLNATSAYWYVISAATVNRDKNEALDAVYQVLSATDGVAQDLARDQLHWTAEIFVPVVVTSAPLFQVTLINDGTYKVDEMTWALLRTRRTSGVERAIWVLHESNLDSSVRAATDVGSFLAYEG
jgi:hypothetical protein